MEFGDFVRYFVAVVEQMTTALDFVNSELVLVDIVVFVLFASEVLARVAFSRLPRYY